MRDHKVCRNCKHNVSSTWLTSPQCKKCSGFDMFERKVEDVQFERMYITTGMRFGKTFLEEEINNNMTIEAAKNFSSTSIPKSVFKTRKEADEALARKYGNRKEYNKMNDKISVMIGGKYFKPVNYTFEQSVCEYPKYTIEVEVNPMFMQRGVVTNITYNPNTLIKNVIFNPPATIVFWADNSKTVVKSQNDEPFDPEKGLAMAIVKKCFGNQGNYFNEIKKWTEPYIEDQNKIAEVLLGAILATNKAKSDDECQTK